MSAEYKHPIVIGTIVLSLLAGISMLFFHVQGYDTSIGWNLTTEPELDDVVAYEFEKGSFAFQVKGERVTLTEAFYGDEIKPLSTLSLTYLLVIFLGIGILIACSTYLKQWGFLIFSIVFALFLTQLNLSEYFAVGQWVILIPFGSLIGIAYFFQSYFKNATFLARIAGVCAVMALLVTLLPDGIGEFTNYFFGNGIVPFMLIVFLFLAMVSEELLFGLVFLLTQTRGAKGNENHLFILGGIYILNLAGYYLNKAGILDFSFTFMNPYVLLFISFCVAIWSYHHKYQLTQRAIHFIPFLVSMLAIGLIVFSILGLGFAKGNDGIYEGIHYLIIYTHLAFGFMFLAYILMNLVNPLINGFQIYKIIYQPQPFHYITARLGGLAMVAAFYFLSSQAALNLFRSAKYNFLGDIEMQAGAPDLAISYYKRSEFYGYSTHYPNYQLGSIYLNKGNQPEARNHFEKASARYPSAQAYLNSSNLQRSTGLGLSTAILEQGLLSFPDKPELINNLGIINKKSGINERAFGYFKDTEITDSWNQAPQANKWGVLSILRDIKGEDARQAFDVGNPVVKTNVLSALLAADQQITLAFDSSVIYQSPYPLHKQAFLLNAALVFADTTLQNQIERELTRPIPGLQTQLSKAQALNMYMEGKVKSAFLAYDQIQLGKSGAIAGTTLNEMGILAMDQHAPILARDFFDKAIEAGNVPARLNKLVALLEAGQFSFARQFLNDLIASDTVYVPLSYSLQNVFIPDSDTTLETLINGIYYRVKEYKPEELAIAIQPFNSAVQDMIISKLKLDLENSQNSDMIEAYEISKINLKFNDYSSLEKWELISMAKQRPFDERLVLMTSEYLAEDNSIDAYNYLHEMLDFNPYSIPILKALALKALDINLPDYAQPAMITLSNLMTALEYVEFQAVWYKKREDIKDDWPY
ncbi:MAG: hypothetical protein GY816_18630 [Cytophagales bacterium]|nr:hypothetical protein [Cytophagales bacterium]